MMVKRKEAGGMPRKERQSVVWVSGHLLPWSRRHRSRELDMNSGNDLLEPIDRVTALGALYQAERQDSAGMLIASLAVIAGGLTYLGVALAVLNNVSVPGGHWTAAFLAFPLWVVASYHVLLAANAIVRQSSIEIIEGALFEMTGLDKNLREKVGSRAGQRAMNIAEQPNRFRWHTVITYGGPLIIIVGFSVYCLDVAAKLKGWGSVPVLTAGAVYFVLFFGIVFAWLLVMQMAGNVQKP
jgi:hypothetical protein